MKKNKIIVSFICFVALIIAVWIYTYLNRNYIGFIDVDLADYVYLSVPDSSYIDYPKIDHIWDHKESYREDVLKENNIDYDSVEDIRFQSETIDKVKEIYLGLETDVKSELVQNGDVINTKINYDQELARDLKINITNDSISYPVNGMLETIEPSDINDSVIDKLDKAFPAADALNYAKDKGKGIEYLRPNVKYSVRDSKYYFCAENKSNYGQVELYSPYDVNIDLDWPVSKDELSYIVVKATDTFNTDDNNNSEVSTVAKSLYIAKDDNSVLVETPIESDLSYLDSVLIGKNNDAESIENNYIREDMDIQWMECTELET